MNNSKTVPFNRPFFVGKELHYISQAVAGGKISGNGPFSEKCQRWLEKCLKTPCALLTQSCTAALEMAAILCDLQEGDEVIMPSYTFVSTANAFVLRGAVPVFIDIREDTLNIDEGLIEAAITPKTRAIVVVHYGGRSCEMEKIMEIARRYNLRVIEDAAQAMLSSYRKQPLGSIGDLGCISFHETKNVISGEGGALLVNDEKLIERAEIIWEKGTNRRQFFKGEVDKYTWVDVGSSFLPSELTAAFLYAQFEHAELIIEKRRELFRRYLQGLGPFLVDKAFASLPDIDSESSCNGHLFYLQLQKKEMRQSFLSELKKVGVHCTFHYVPLHSSPAGMKYGRVGSTMSKTDAISERLVRLPLFFDMSFEDQDYVIQKIKEVIEKQT